MVLLLALHLVVGAGLMAATRRLAGRRLLFLLAAVPPAATLVWLLVQLPDVVDGEVLTETVEWIPELGVDLALRLDGFAALMLVLVAGIGVLVIELPWWPARRCRALPPFFGFVAKGGRTSPPSNDLTCARSSRQPEVARVHQC